MSESLFLDPFSPRPSDREPVPADTPDASAESPPAEASSSATVPLDAEQSAEAFVEYAHLWWPVDWRATGAEGQVFFEHGQLTEEGDTGEAYLWAEVAGVDAGSLELYWYGRGGSLPPARDSSAPSGTAVPPAVAPAASGHRVVVQFTAGHAGTVVTVRWDGAASWVRADWTELLAAYARFAGGTVSRDAEDTEPTGDR